MIKHRFILRDVSDFKVFAAIPVEASLLTWKTWQRPPDWEALKELIERAANVTAAAEPAFLNFAEAARKLCKFAREYDDKSVRVAELVERMESHAAWATHGAERVAASADNLRGALVAVPPPDDAGRTPELFVRGVDMLTDALIIDVDPERSLDTLHESYTKHVAALNARLPKMHEHLEPIKREMDAVFRVFVKRTAEVRDCIGKRRELAVRIAELRSSEPLPTTPCPPGLPFAAYTVEFGDVIVNVVEGHAWVHARRIPDVVIEGVKRGLSAAVSGLSTEERRKLATAVAADVEKAEFAVTDEEKRVVEIVSQMLCERSLNPKADTKIPVREVDPAKAHQTRQAEQREAVKGHPPSVRTIKFEVTPPRYLREAAEHILSSPRKAHWVIGHWRNQFHGEKRALRRQTWIKPHIRGLGEASGTTSRVVAPHAGQTT